MLGLPEYFLALALLPLHTGRISSITQRHIWPDNATRDLEGDSTLNWFQKIKSAAYQAAIVIVARYRDDLLSLQAMSLTYSTLLSLIPFLAVMFSVLKAFGVQNAIEPFLSELLQPLGPNSDQITTRIVKFVENIRVGILGGVGLAMLFYTVVSLVGTIEDAFNQIWRLPRSRTWGHRFMAYLSVVLVGPVLVFTALALTASAQSYWLVERLTRIQVVGELFTLLTQITPFVLLCATFTFLYKLLPYTKVPFSSAVIGGATTAILWQLAGAGFTAFAANSSRYAAIYSSFAIMVCVSDLALCRLADCTARRRGGVFSSPPTRICARGAPRRSRPPIPGVACPDCAG